MKELSIKNLGKNAPVIDGQFNFADLTIPARGYVLGKMKHMEETRQHLEKVFSKTTKFDEFDSLDYLLGILWEENKKPIVDIFGYKLTSDSWPGNAEMKNAIYKNGKIQSSKIITCESGLIILAQEGMYRRTTKSLEEYTRFMPGLDYLFGERK